MPPLSANSQPPKNSLITPPSVALVVLLILSIVGSVLLFMSRQDYKNKSDAKVQTAVIAAIAEQKQSDQQTAAQAAKAPYKTFTGSATYGSITFSYPKTYSAYNDTTSSDTPINAYFYPDVVPSPQANVSYALRLELTSQTYADVLNGYSSQISDGSIKALAYVPSKLKGVANVSAGTILTGAISTENNDARGTLMLIKVRDKTLKIYDESPNFDADFTNIILPSLTFTP